MKHKAFLFSILISLISLLLICVHGCKDEAVVEPPPPANQDPNIPKLVSPSNEATLINFTPLLDWEDFSGASSYRIQISLDANFAGIMILDSSGITASELNIMPGLLSTNIYYYWRVNALTASNITPWSAVWRFRVILEPPEAPTLISPPNGSNNQLFTPVLDWSDVSSAETYRVQISRAPIFNTLTLDSIRLTESQFQVPQYVLIPNLQYYWRVNASNSGGASTGPWSAVWSFTTMDGPAPNAIKGSVTFVDTNFLQMPFYYKVGAFDHWPPVSAPLEFDSLNIMHVGNLYKADYFIKRLTSGSYYIAVYPDIGISLSPAILGIYGCDTVHIQYSGCPYSPSTVSIINNWGIENINFLSWADTTKRIF